MLLFLSAVVLADAACTPTPPQGAVASATAAYEAGLAEGDERKGWEDQLAQVDTAVQMLPCLDEAVAVDDLGALLLTGVAPALGLGRDDRARALLGDVRRITGWPQVDAGWGVVAARYAELVDTEAVPTGSVRLRRSLRIDGVPREGLRFDLPAGWHLAQWEDDGAWHTEVFDVAAARLTRVGPARPVRRGALAGVLFGGSAASIVGGALLIESAYRRQDVALRQGELDARFASGLSLIGVGAGLGVGGVVGLTVGIDPSRSRSGLQASLTLPL